MNPKNTKPTTTLRTLLFAFLALCLSLSSLCFLHHAPALAANPICSQEGVSEEVLKANGCKSDAPSLENVVINIINAVVGALALVAVIFVIVGGVNYMTSAGDSGKLQKAKNTILYAVIGLVICVLAFAIVNFVIVRILGNGPAAEDDEDGRLPSTSLESIA